jgi:hypothetical protein
MSWRTGLALALVSLGIPSLSADTITTTDHASVNGSVTTMANGEITLIARYDAGDKTLLIKLKDTDIVEFNGGTSNPGSPPREAGFGPSRDSKLEPPPSQPQNDANTIVLRGNQRRPCKLVGIDAQFVHCEGKDGDYNRRIVLRVIVGAE